MTPATFVATVAPYARAVAANTGLDCRLFVTQWALETGWWSPNSTASVNNLAGIGCHPCTYGYGCVSGFCALHDLDAFVQQYLLYIHNGNYGGVLASAGQSLSAQMQALGASPWAGSHYNNGGGPGSSLQSLYSQFAGTIDSACPGSTPNPTPNPTPTPTPTQQPIQTGIAVPSAGLGALAVIAMAGAGGTAWYVRSRRAPAAITGGISAHLEQRHQFGQ